MSSSDEEADEADFPSVIEEIDFDSIENMNFGEVMIYIKSLISTRK